MLSSFVLFIGFILIAFMAMNGLAAFSAFILPPLLVMYIVQHWYDIRNDRTRNRRKIEKNYYDDDVY